MKITSVILGLWLSFQLSAYDFPDVKMPWLRAAPPGVKMMAAYLTIENQTTEKIKLVGAYSPAFGMTEVHRSIEENGQYRMEEQKSLLLNPGDMLSFEPGGLHIMLMMPKETFKIGDVVRICLIYEDTVGNEQVQHLDFPVKTSD